jgi:hypothetical protein
LRGYCGVCSRANSCCQQPVRLLNGRGRPPQGSTCSYVNEWYWHCKAYTPSGGSSGSGSGSSGSGSGSSCKQVGCRLGVQAPGACRDGQAGGRPRPIALAAGHTTRPACQPPPAISPPRSRCTSSAAASSRAQRQMPPTPASAAPRARSARRTTHGAGFLQLLGCQQPWAASQCVGGRSLEGLSAATPAAIRCIHQCQPTSASACSSQALAVRAERQRLWRHWRLRRLRQQQLLGHAGGKLVPPALPARCCRLARWGGRNGKCSSCPACAGGHVAAVRRPQRARKTRRRRQLHLLPQQRLLPSNQPVALAGKPRCCAAATPQWPRAGPAAQRFGMPLHRSPRAPVTTERS